MRQMCGPEIVNKNRSCSIIIVHDNGTMRIKFNQYFIDKNKIQNNFDDSEVMAEDFILQFKHDKFYSMANRE